MILVMGGTGKVGGELVKPIAQAKIKARVEEDLRKLFPAAALPEYLSGGLTELSH